jgi:hypothetical protein
LASRSPTPASFVFVLDYLFRGGPRPCCGDAADASDEGNVDISDPSFTLNWLFRGGPEPNPPGPAGCDFDPTPDDLHERFVECAYPPESCAGPAQ